MTSPRDDDPHSERLPRPGDRIAGKYVVERVLKRGGMGVVLAARHADLGQPVAIKVLLPNLAGDASMVARFVREGRAVSALRSDHVVRVHDVGRLDNGTPYLVMEMLHGSDLDRRVRKGGPLPWQEAVGYVMQACEALVEAHAIGIVHRDLKPSNLFLVELPSGVSTVKVLDFGISKADGLDVPMNEAHAITTTEAVLGSPTFMAPEQLKSAKYVDARADIWSLGLVLHFLIAGKLAFDADTLGGYLIKILQEPAIPLRVFRPDAPPELEAIVLRCLEKDPALRFPSASDLRAALAPLAPFAAHVSGVYSAAKVSGMWSAAVAPSSSPTASSLASGMLGPSMPTPAGGLAPSMPTPTGGALGPSMPTPASHAGIATPVVPYSVGPLLTTSQSDAPSAAAPFGSSSTQASWTSGKLGRPNNLRWAVVIGAVAVCALVAALLWSRDPAPPATTPAAGPAGPSAAAASSSAPSAAPSASSADAPPPGPSATASASASAGAPGPVSTGAAKAPSSPAGAGTGRPRTPPTKRISGPMETDL
jgi:eukaryotic-like serine/threonine-protein kinase